MRAPLSLALFGLAAIIGPMLGTSMPWAADVHALVFGTQTWGWWRGSPHVLPAYLAMNAGLVIAWIGTTWACVLAALNERMFAEERIAKERVAARERHWDRQRDRQRERARW